MLYQGGTLDIEIRAETKYWYLWVLVKDVGTWIVKLVFKYLLRSHDSVCMMYLSSGSITRVAVELQWIKFLVINANFSILKLCVHLFIAWWKLWITIRSVQMSAIQVVSICEYSIIDLREYLNAKKAIIVSVLAKIKSGDQEKA